ncbi:MAG: type ISP restriction/modification enzyme, partial [Planctomycetota bacterium]
MADIREMLIQHILTEDIFITIFSNAQFHQENNIARELAKITKTFFVGAIQKNILLKIDPYIKIIKAAASNIFNHHEKQRFLKVFYENFYKTYNPAGADRLGIIYTPNEIVRFIVEGADHLINKHFSCVLGDKDVEILDPATGTGTFITEVMEYIPKNILPYKYENEIHCNEVAILPYYIANLNIEYTYAQKMGIYAEFKNICFADTLDNLGFIYDNKQSHFLSISAENLERIKQQNQRKISVIMGNPPYNANQLNENEYNTNRSYPQIDKRIKETYIKYSTAQKTKLYDMYSRFIRWASDRLAPNGVIAFVTNSSFIDKKAYDGFRKVLTDEFNEIYVINMKGDARTSGERRRQEGGNVFSDQIRVGVAILFLVKNQQTKGCKVYYNCVDDYVKAEVKKAYLRDNKLKELPFTHIIPDKNNNWINLTENSWDELLPIASKHTKVTGAKSIGAIFRVYSTGISTNRDEWVIDLSEDNLQQKMKYFTEFFNIYIQQDDEYDTRIKWSRNLKQRYHKGLKEKFSKARIRKFQYRPYCLHNVYYSDLFIDEHGLAQQITPEDNCILSLSGFSSTKPFQCLVTKTVPSLDLLEKTQCLPLYSYDKLGNKVDNITDWALKRFKEHYKDTEITKKAIFQYVYAVLHHPAYREKYVINL